MRTVCSDVLVDTDSDSEDGVTDPWINRRQPVIYRKKHPGHCHLHNASPGSDDHESLLHSDHLEKCTYIGPTPWITDSESGILVESGILGPVSTTRVDGPSERPELNFRPLFKLDVFHFEK